VNERRFESIRRDHAAICQALDRLDIAANSISRSPSLRQRHALVAAVQAFLGSEPRLLSHMAAEEAGVIALLERHVREDAGSAAVLRQEHQTARALLVLLRQSAARVGAGSAEAVPELAAASQDLSKLLRNHIHKEDAVVHPLLRRLLAWRRRA
jgi:hemerythrin-like domain-containing protein